MKKLTKTLLSVVAIAVMAASCDLSNFNENEKDPSQVPASTLFTNAEVQFGTFLHQVDVNIGIFQFMAQHWTMTTYTSETRYNLEGRTIAGNDWDILYESLNNLQQASKLITQIPDVEVAPPIKTNRQAMIEIMQVLLYSKLVDIWGNVPYTKALDPSNPTPSYDEAKMIYTSLIDSLNTAIESIDPSAAGFGSADVYYNGDMEKWIRFGNSLKLRLGMMFSDVNRSKAQQIVESAVAGGVLMSIADNATIPFEPALPDANPVWENVIASGRDDYVPAKPLVSRMNELNDPRRAIWFTLEGGEYKGGIYGENNEYSNYSHFDDTVTLPQRPGLILSYSEVEFLLAEARERGFDVGGTAIGHFKKAIKADMRWWNKMAALAGAPEMISDAEITDFVTDAVAAYISAPGWRDVLGLHKWISLFGQYLQAWTSFRRLDSPTLKPPPVNHPQINVVPQRYKYPVSELRYNKPNYEQASEAIGGNTFTNRLWWDEHRED